MIKRRLMKVFISALLIVGFVITFSWVKFLYSPIVTTDEGYKYNVQPGTTIKTVINDLYFKEIINNRFYLSLLVRFRGDGQELKAGEYFFAKGTSPTKMLNQMMTGKGLVYHAFTIIPGWTFKELRDAILREPNLRHTLQNYSDNAVMTSLGSSILLPEGQFFPDTYYFAGGNTDIALLKRAYKTMQTKINLAWRNRIPGLPYQNPQEILVAASLIEKEAFLDEERPIIARVLINRLQKGMLLQIDPTVIYGMGSRYDGKIRKEDLLENTPYNTYVHKGLPPTPIAIPSLDSIMAVVHPSNNDYLYYVAKGDGSHQFSVTYIDHRNAIGEANKQNDFFNKELLRYYLQKNIITSS